MRRAEDHRRAGQTLLAAGRFSVSCHLAGPAVGCALKARIARAFPSGTWSRRQFAHDRHTDDPFFFNTSRPVLDDLASLPKTLTEGVREV